MKLKRTRKVKLWLYEYKSSEEKEVHKAQMIAAKFTIMNEADLTLEVGQVLREDDLKDVV